MEGVKRTNAVVVRNSLLGQGRGTIRRDSYTMKVDRRRNCYSCEEFGHLVQNCRNQRIMSQKRRMEYGDNMNGSQNLNEEENLIVLD